jgi:CHAT domain-containing protein
VEKYFSRQRLFEAIALVIFSNTFLHIAGRTYQYGNHTLFERFFESWLLFCSPVLIITIVLQAICKIILKEEPPELVKVLCADSAIASAPMIVCMIYSFSPMIILSPTIISQEAVVKSVVENFLNLFADFKLIHIRAMGFGISIFILLMPFSAISLSVVSVIFLLYFLSQFVNFKTSRKISYLAVLSLRIGRIVAAINLAILSMVITALIPVILHMVILFFGQSFDKLNMDASLLFAITLMLFLVYCEFSIVLLGVVLVGLLIVVALRLLPFKIRSKRFINVFLCNYIAPFIRFIGERVLPFSIMGPISNVFYAPFISALYDFQSDNTILLNDQNSRNVLVKTVIEYIDSNPFFLIKSRGFKQTSALLRIAASKMFSLGDLNRANLLYEELLLLIENAEQESQYRSWHTLPLIGIIDQSIDELFRYYIKTEQYISALKLRKYTLSLHSLGHISTLTFLSNSMRFEFAFKSDKEYSSTIRAENSLGSAQALNITAILIDRLNIGWRINTLQDLDLCCLAMICNNSEAETVKAFVAQNSNEISSLRDQLKKFFRQQEVIYAFNSVACPEIQLDSAEIQAALEPDPEFTMFGYRLSFPNPFLEDNQKLIPLILLQTQSKAFPDIVPPLLENARDESRTIDIAFLECCYGKWLINQGKLEEGSALLYEGIALYEGIRNTIRRDQVGIGFGSRYLAYYDWAIEAALTQGQIELAFDYAERSKARALLDLVSKRTARSDVDSNDPSRLMLNQIQDIDLTLTLLDSQRYSNPFFVKWLPKLWQNPMEQAFIKRQKQYRNDLTNQRAQILRQLEATDPVATALVTLKPLAWKSTETLDGQTVSFSALWENRTISENEALLCFHVTHHPSLIPNQQTWSNVIGFVLIKQNNQLSLHHHVIRRQEDLHKLQNQSRNLVNPDEMESGIINLSEKLILPLINNLPAHIQALTITANSDLQFIPWAALYTDEDISSVVLESYSIRSVPSLSLLYLLGEREHSRSDSTNQILVAGLRKYPNLSNYLFWAGTEVARIAEIYQVEPLRDEAVDQHFIHQFKYSQIIHYSGHGNYISSSDIDSHDKISLNFYHQNLSASQILNGALDNPTARAMILSACLTGRGDLTISGNEVLGMERALFHAGLSALLTTLWNVDDFSTALLMIKFHSIWKNSDNTLSTMSTALNQSQIWLKNLTWKQLKQDFPEIEEEILRYIRHCEVLVDGGFRDRNEEQIEYYKEKVLPALASQSLRKPFGDSRFWAAFQIKGLG